MGDGVLGQGSRTLLGARPGLEDVRTGDQDRQRRRRADEQGVHHDPEGLDESLLDGVAHGGRARGAGCPSESRLIGEQAAAHTVEQRGGHSAGQAAQPLAQAEGALDDGAHRLEGLDGVGQEDGENQHQVGQRHERGQVLRHAGHGAQAPQEDRRGQGHDEDGSQAR